MQLDSARFLQAEKGQVTIPVQIRERLGLLPHTEVEFVVDGEDVQIVKRDRPTGDGRGDRIVRRLRGTCTVRMSTDETMALTRGE